MQIHLLPSPTKILETFGCVTYDFGPKRHTASVRFIRHPTARRLAWLVTSQTQVVGLRQRLQLSNITEDTGIEDIGIITYLC